LLTSRILGAGADVLVYGALLRALPRRPQTQYVTRISSELALSDLLRLIDAGGAAWLADNLSGDQVIAGLVHSTWATYAYRSKFPGHLWQGYLAPRLGADSWAARVTAPGPPPQPATAQKSKRDPTLPDWTRSDYGPPNANWDALELLGRLCERSLPGR